MGKRLPPVPGQPPLARHIEKVKGSNALERARAAAPAYSQQLARRFARAIYDTKGRVKQDVVDENLQLLLQASRELGSPDASLGAGGEVGALTVSDLWAKMPDREKSTYLERMSTTAPGGEGEAVAREFLTNMAKGAEVYGPRSPNAGELDITAPARADARPGNTVVLGDENNPEPRDRTAIDADKRISAIINGDWRDAQSMRLDTRAPIDRNDFKEGLPDEVQQQVKLLDQLPKTVVQTTRDAKDFPRDIEMENRRKIAGLGKDLKTSLDIPSLQQLLRDTNANRIDENFRRLSGTEPGLDVVTDYQRAFNQAFADIKRSDASISDATAYDLATQIVQQSPVQDGTAFASAGTVPIKAFSEPQQTIRSLKMIGADGEPVFRDVADPAPAQLGFPDHFDEEGNLILPQDSQGRFQLFPSSRSSYVQSQDPFRGPSNKELNDYSDAVGGSGVVGGLMSSRGTGNTIGQILRPETFKADRMAGQPDSLGARLREFPGEPSGLGDMTGGFVSGDSDIRRLQEEINRLGGTGAADSLRQRIDALKSRTMKFGGEDNSKSVAPFRENGGAGYNVLEFNDSSQARYNKKLMSMLGSLPGQYAEDFSAFDLDWLIPELNTKRLDLDLLKAGRYDSESLANIILDKANIVDPDIHRELYRKLEPMVAQGITQRAMDRAQYEFNRYQKSLGEQGKGLPGSEILFGEDGMSRASLLPSQVRPPADAPKTGSSTDVGNIPFGQEGRTFGFDSTQVMPQFMPADHSINMGLLPQDQIVNPYRIDPLGIENEGDGLSVLLNRLGEATQPDHRMPYPQRGFVEQPVTEAVARPASLSPVQQDVFTGQMFAAAEAAAGGPVDSVRQGSSPNKFIGTTEATADSPAREVEFDFDPLAAGYSADVQLSDSRSDAQPTWINPRYKGVMANADLEGANQELLDAELQGDLAELDGESGGYEPSFEEMALASDSPPLDDAPTASSVDLAEPGAELAGEAAPVTSEAVAAADPAKMTRAQKAAATLAANKLAQEQAATAQQTTTAQLPAGSVQLAPEAPPLGDTADLQTANLNFVIDDAASTELAPEVQSAVAATGPAASPASLTIDVGTPTANIQQLLQQLASQQVAAPAPTTAPAPAQVAQAAAQGAAQQLAPQAAPLPNTPAPTPQTQATRNSGLSPAMRQTLFGAGRVPATPATPANATPANPAPAPQPNQQNQWPNMSGGGSSAHAAAQAAMLSQQAEMQRRLASMTIGRNGQTTVVEETPNHTWLNFVPRKIAANPGKSLAAAGVTGASVLYSRSGSPPPGPPPSEESDAEFARSILDGPTVDVPLMSNPDMIMQSGTMTRPEDTIRRFMPKLSNPR